MIDNHKTKGSNEQKLGKTRYNGSISPNEITYRVTFWVNPTETSSLRMIDNNKTKKKVDRDTRDAGKTR